MEVRSIKKSEIRDQVGYGDRKTFNRQIREMMKIEGCPFNPETWFTAAHYVRYSWWQWILKNC